jgi:uncharacterized membrane protein YdbT with pleckstrin-like domain
MPQQSNQSTEAHSTDDIYLELRPSLLKKPGNWVIIFLSLILALYLYFFYIPLSGDSAEAMIKDYGHYIFFSLSFYMTFDKIWDKYTTKYYINNREIRIRTGFITREADSCRPEDILAIKLVQPFMERIVGVGHLEIATSGTDEAEIIFYGLKDPVTFRNVIHDLIKRNRDKHSSQ